jgi:hypothetical protein
VCAHESFENGVNFWDGMNMGTDSRKVEKSDRRHQPA